MTDRLPGFVKFSSLSDLYQGLVRQLDEGRKHRDSLWRSYWEGRRMVTVPEVAPSILDTPEHRTNMIERDREFSRRIDAMKSYEPVSRPFASFPNLAPKDGPIVMTTDRIAANLATEDTYNRVIRDCIARLKNARAKESTNRNLSTLLAVVVKVQKDLESLVGDEGRDGWQRDDAAVEERIAREER